jgi:hypothetical protein
MNPPHWLPEKAGLTGILCMRWVARRNYARCIALDSQHGVVGGTTCLQQNQAEENEKDEWVHSESLNYYRPLPQRVDMADQMGV